MGRIDPFRMTTDAAVEMAARIETLDGALKHYRERREALEQGVKDLREEIKATAALRQSYADAVDVITNR